MTRETYKQKQWNKLHKINENGIIERQCTQCQEWKEESTNNFYLLNKSYPEKGFHAWCKTCVSKKNQEREYQNYERTIQYQINYNKKSHRKLAMRERSKQQKDEGQQRLWRENNKDKCNQYVATRELHKNHEISSKEWSACKEYFNNECAYCGLSIEEHYGTYRGKISLHDFQRDHIYNDGENDLSNCIPACKSCNDHKWKFEFNDWYKEDNPNFTQERYDKIMKWITEDYKQYIEESRPKRKYERKTKIT